MYKDVTQLTRDQLEELKETFFYENWDQPVTLAYTYPAEIPDATIFEHYAGVLFVDADFFCTMEV